jgi:hypothetical protein
VQFAGRLVGVLQKLPPLPSGLNLYYQLQLLTPISFYFSLVWHLTVINLASSALQHFNFGLMYVNLFFIWFNIKLTFFKGRIPPEHAPTGSNRCATKRTRRTNDGQPPATPNPSSGTPSCHPPLYCCSQSSACKFMFY